MKARGSAIIIAMLLIAAIGGIAFSIGRLLFIESTSAAFYENGSVAYYAAESGLEEAFLRYRYNRNAEVPFVNWELGDTDKKTFRTNIDKDRVLVDTNNGRPITNSLNENLGGTFYWPTYRTDQIYDLRMGYIGTNNFPWFGPDDIAPAGLGPEDSPGVEPTSASDTPYYIPRDESIKIDLTGLDLRTAGNDLMLRIRFYDATSFNGQALKACRALTEVKFVVEDTSNNFKEYKNLLNYDPVNCSTSSMLNMPLLSLTTTNAFTADANNYITLKKDRLQTAIESAGGSIPAAGTGQVTLFIKPLYYDAAIALSLSPCIDNSCTKTKTQVISGPVTKVESTGYYGGATKKLEADIDRQSGTVYDLYDYVINKTN